MSDESSIVIWGKSIPYSSKLMPIHDLRYFVDNPRVGSFLDENDKKKDDDELQILVETIMLEQSSVKNIISSIEEHGGLHVPILVRHDTKEVIDGNSRLAAFRFLHSKNHDKKWELIQCQCVSKLTEEQQDAYLNQIHIKGQTSWDPYVKASFSYDRFMRDIRIEEIARRSLESPREIEKRIKTIQMMKENGDQEKSHFSYYDAILRKKVIWESISNKKNVKIKNVVFNKIKQLGTKKTNNGDFTAIDLRDKFPIILKKRNVLNKFISGKLTLDEAYQNARPSNPQQKVKIAMEKIKDVHKDEVSRIEKQDVNALLADINKLLREVKRAHRMVETVKEEKEKQ